MHPQSQYWRCNTRIQIGCYISKREPVYLDMLGGSTRSSLKLPSNHNCAMLLRTQDKWNYTKGIKYDPIWPWQIWLKHRKVCRILTSTFLILFCFVIWCVRLRISFGSGYYPLYHAVTAFISKDVTIYMQYLFASECFLSLCIWFKACWCLWKIIINTA